MGMGGRACAARSEAYAVVGRAQPVHPWRCLRARWLHPNRHHTLHCACSCARAGRLQQRAPGGALVPAKC
eukprot:5216103-Prymnesium_polylepis.2